MKVFKHPGASTECTKLSAIYRLLILVVSLLAPGERMNIGGRRDANGGDFDYIDYYND